MYRRLIAYLYNENGAFWSERAEPSYAIFLSRLKLHNGLRHRPSWSFFSLRNIVKIYQNEEIEEIYRCKRYLENMSSRCTVKWKRLRLGN